MKAVVIAIIWLLANVAGLMVGSYLGATTEGIIPATVEGYTGLVAGDLVFGACIGLAQWLVMRIFRFAEISPLWIIFTSVGFMLGARAGSLLTYRIMDLHEALQPSIIFGIFMGGSIGTATYISFRQPHINKMFLLWVFISTLAWIAGEAVAFNSHFSQETVPHVSLTIGCITGLGLGTIQKNRTGNVFS